MVIRFFLSRDLARKLDINLARWKRWAREFLPPDPLGGMQSGFARQYSIKDAFTVFLGGHLVGDLKISIPDTKQILADLNTWLAAQDYYLGKDTGTNLPQGAEALVADYRIYISKKQLRGGPDFGFVYRIQGEILSEDAPYQGHDLRHTYFTETILDSYPETDGRLDFRSTKLLNITAVYQYFMERIITADTPAP